MCSSNGNGSNKVRGERRSYECVQTSTGDRQTSTSRYKGSAGVQTSTVNEHEASAGITNKSDSVQISTRDGTNEGKQVQGECRWKDQ